MSKTYSVAAYFAAVADKKTYTDERTVTLARGKTLLQAREMVACLYAKKTAAVARMFDLSQEQAAQLQGASRYFIPENEEA